jgi:hypothetical protein
MKKISIIIGIIAVMLIVIAVTRKVTHNNDVYPSTNVKEMSANESRILIPSPCGPQLAAQDLAGGCRSTPNSTPGALEAVDRLKP